MRDDILAQVQAAHPRVKVIAIGDIEFAIRAPKRFEYKQFRSKAMNADQRADAMEDLLRLLVVACGEVAGPGARAAFDAVLEDYPGLCESKDVTRAVEQFVGMQADDSGKGSATTSSTSAAAPGRSSTA